MSKTLSTIIQNMIDSKDIKITIIFKINGTDYTNYLIDRSVSMDKEFGSNSASFTLINNEGIFGDGGSNEINVGDVVELIEKYFGDSSEFHKFFGKVNQRSIDKEANRRTITLSCLDYISTLQFLDIDYIAEANKIECTNEILSPNYLSSPNNNMAQLYDFAHEAIADTPRAILTIRNKGTTEEDPQFDGFEIYAEVGQVKLGSPLNARYNYDLVAKNYFFYPEGLYVEDIIRDILILENGYGNFLFDESSPTALINNHLTSDFFTEEEKAYDTLTPNTSSSEITIKTKLTTNFIVGDSTLIIESTEGLPTSGEANVNGDIFTWTGKTNTTLTGIPTTGNYALKSHQVGAVVKYTKNYPIGQVWYLTFSNLFTVLASGHFTIPGANLNYFDKRYGRIILDVPISLSSTVTCNTNYSFSTLQATGVELNKISFRSREVENRYEALNKLRSYLAPNFIIRTIGDNKIWASYLSQKLNSYDYELELATKITYMEDQDLYTRVVMFAKNKYPKNIMYNSGITFETTGQSYTATVTKTELAYLREEQGYYVFGNVLSGVGKIKLGTIVPKVYINDVPMDNQAHRELLMPVTIETTQRTESTTTQESK